MNKDSLKNSASEINVVRSPQEQAYQGDNGSRVERLGKRIREAYRVWRSPIGQWLEED